MRAMYRLIHPLLQCRIELLGLGGKHQHIAISQPDILGPGRRGDRRSEGAVGCSQRDTRGGQDLGVPTAGNQHGGHTGSSQHGAHCAANGASTNDHVSVAV